MITRECFSAEGIRDEYACSEAGGSFLPRYNFCAQPIAVKNLKLGNRIDCNQAGGLWYKRLSECRIPQDLLLEIDPGNPEANCGVAGVGACAVVRWLQRERSGLIRMVTLNIGQK